HTRSKRDWSSDVCSSDLFRHVNTFGGNPAACALALKNIEIIEREKLSERSAEQGHRLLKGLKELEAHTFVGDVRGFGLMAGIEIVENKDTKEPGSNERVGKLIADSKQRGLIIGKNRNTVEG